MGFIYAIGAAAIWGLVYTIDQKILSATSPVTFLFINSLLIAILMLPFALFDYRSIKNLITSDRINIVLIITAVILAALANFLIFSSIKSLGVATASIIEIAYPFFVVLFSYILYRSSPNIYFFIGGALIFFGSFLIIRFG